MVIVSVVIPVYNEEGDIKECLSTLEEQSINRKYFEVIVVDDGSTDKTLKIVGEQFPRVKILKQNHKGPGIARNLGSSKAKGKILVFVDADMSFDKDYIKELIKPILEKDSKGTIHLYEYVKNKENVWALCWGKRITVGEDGKGKIFRAILKEEFDKIGGFDPKRGYADDQTLYEKSGLKSDAVEKAVCYHENPGTLREVFKHSIWIGAALDFEVLKIPFLNFFAAVFGYMLSPILIIKNSFVKSRELGARFMIYYPVFGFVKYTGNFLGVIKKILLRTNVK